jgi:hypothetical protein
LHRQIRLLNKYSAMKRLLVSTLFLLTFLTAHAQKEQTVLGDKAGAGRASGAVTAINSAQIGDDISYARGAFWGIELGRSVLIGWGRFLFPTGSDGAWWTIRTST